MGWGGGGASGGWLGPCLKPPLLLRPPPLPPSPYPLTCQQAGAKHHTFCMNLLSSMYAACRLLLPSPSPGQVYAMESWLPCTT